MAKKKFYAVKIGKTPGIYNTWDECKTQVDGYPGALYQGFATMEDAEAFLGVTPSTNPTPSIPVCENVSTSASNTHAMADMPIPGIDGKCYAVKVGRVPGIYSTWDQCKEQINGFTGASYKKCPDIATAVKFINSGNWPCSREDAEVIAYTDGSFNESERKYGYGVVILYKGSVIKVNGCGENPEVANMQNVAGEIIAAMRAMEFCLNNDVKSLLIVHDYEGTAKFCSGEFEASQKHTKQYSDYYNKVKDKVLIGFEWVKGHSRDTYNDMADQLAKKGCGII